MIPLGMFGAARPRAAGGPPLTYGIVDTLNGSATMTGAGPYVATITGVGLGAPAPDRTIVLSYGINGTGSTVPSAITIGGVEAAIDIAEGDRTGLAICHAHVPDGATGDVQVTMPTSVSGFALIAYRVVGSAAQVHSTDSYTADTALATLSLDTAPGGLVVAASHQRWSGAQTWTGATKDYEPWTTFASTDTEGGPATITVTQGNGQNAKSIAVAYAPA